jgi:DNA-binding winged helix-turn-helix (wHTH) protein
MCVLAVFALISVGNKCPVTARGFGLQGKVYQVLIVLLQKQGEVVTREELKQALWPEASLFWAT